VAGARGRVNSCVICTSRRSCSSSRSRPPHKTLGLSGDTPQHECTILIICVTLAWKQLLTMKMLGRKQSLRGDPILADYGPEETMNESSEIEWVNKVIFKSYVKYVLRICSVVSLISVSANTPKSFENYPNLKYITFIVDLVVTFFFTAEMIAKMHVRGILKGEVPYLKDRWCQFDASMAFFLWISVILHMFEILMPSLVPPYSYLSVMRAPRPLIVVRLIRIFLKFSMPKARLKQIVK
ncbi:unnamed protein product, partial [Meganyctiphanes norvegica]